VISSPFSINRYRWIFVGAIVVITAVQLKMLQMLEVPWQLNLIDSAVTNALLAIALFAVVNALRFYVPESNRFIYLFLWCMVIAGGWLLATWGVLNFILKGNGYLNFVQDSLPVRFAIGALLLGLMIIFSVLWGELQKEKEIDQRKEEAEKLSRDAELFKLRQQLQPHFLFNSLNSINALIGSRPQEAKEMVQKLSEFLRGTLRKDDQQRVKLEEELHHLQLYLDIEKVRFGHRLLTKIDCEPDTMKMEMPALLLQPIVENAIKFGLYDTTEAVTIQIRATAKDHQLIITVENPFDPETSAPNKGTGFGLASVQRRLSLLFGRSDLLETSAAEKIFTTTVKIPQ